MGLWGAADAQGNRALYQPLLDELRPQQRLLEPRHRIPAATWG